MQKRVKGKMAITLAVLLALSPCVAADASTVSPEEKDAQQESPESSTSREHSLDTITVTATKTDTPVETLPVTAHSVDRKAMESRPNSSSRDYGGFLMDLPGVFVAPSALTAPPWVNLRGTGYFVGRTLYLVDGLPVTSSTTPMLTTTISPNDIERIDVVLGPSSALYGANAAGGVVNLITRRGTRDTGATAQAGYASYNTFRANAVIGDQVGNFNYRLSYSRDSSSGFRNQPVDGMLYLYRRGKTGYLNSASIDDANWDKDFVSGRFGWENGFGTGFSLAYNFARFFISGGQPNLISLDDGVQGIGSFRFYSPIGDFMKVTLTAGHQFWNRPSKSNVGLRLVGNDLVLNTAKRYASDSKLLRIPLELQTDFHIIKNNILTAGVFWSTEELKSASRNWNTGASVSKSRTDTDQIAFYFQNQTFLLNDRLSILLGIRYDKWKYGDIYDSASTPSTPAGFSKDTVTYRGAVKYQFNDMFAIRASAGTAYWPGAASWFFLNTNTGSTWREANPGLKPEKTWMADLGLETRVPQWGTSFSVTPYYGEMRDMIIYRYDPHPTLPGVTIVRTRNASNARIYGVELLLNQKITKQLSGTATLTLNHSRITKDPVNKGNKVSNAPDYSGSVGLTYENPEWINASAYLRFVGERYYDSENTNLDYYRMKPYEDLGLKLWRDFKLSERVVLTLSGSATNLLDQKHETEFIYVDPGRIFEANLAVKYRF